jgi:hypothetical protein
MKNDKVKMNNIVNHDHRGGDKCRLREANEDTSLCREGSGVIFN